MVRGWKSETDGELILLPGVDEKLALVFSTNGNKVKKLDGIIKKLTKSVSNGIFLFQALFWYRLTSIIQFRNSKPTLVNGLYNLYAEKINE